MRRWQITVAVFCSLALAGLSLVVAQEAPAPETAEVAVCSRTLEAVWTAASDACLGKPDGFICNGGSAPAVEPTGAVSNALALVGSVVDATEVTSIHTPVIAPEANVVGVAWLRLIDPPLTALLMGDVHVRDVAPEGFPTWQSMVVDVGFQIPTCGTAPHSAFIIQSTAQEDATRVVINGASVAFNGTLLVKTAGDNTIFVALSGLATVTSLGGSEPLRAGQQVVVAHAPDDYETPAGVPSVAQPLNTIMTDNLPVPMLDLPVSPPQPGFVSTQGTVNLRAAPDISGALLLEVPPGEIMSVLGINDAGDWYHVRLNNGVTGWMFGELLVNNLGTVQTVYNATPAPPQRFGELGTVARVISPAGVNLRSAPALGFPVVGTLVEGTRTTLLARSPYSPWVKVDADGAVGWVALVALDTRAIIEALPVDFDVPPPPATPTPTRVPGSFGNAFPDPRGGG